DEVNVLSSVGLGFMGIKLDDDDACLGAALIGNRFDALVLETSGGHHKEFRRGAYKVTSRGGLGHEVVKRAGVVRVVPPPLQPPHWDNVVGEEKADSGKRDASKNGHSNGKSFFE